MMIDLKAALSRGLLVVSVAVLWLHQSAPVSALVCANAPSRTMFVGGPGTDACSNINDQATCIKSFHRSGAGPLAPCVWNGSSCFGNTANFEDSAPQSCEDLPDPQTCIDPSRTVKLTGGDGDTRPQVCGSMTDEASCEMAWHTTRKGVGIACCWDGDNCVGSANGFWDGSCTHGNTCFVGVATTSGAPAMSLWAFGAVGVALLAFGTRQLQRKGSAI